jgi:hypothetical protein
MPTNYRLAFQIVDGSADLEYYLEQSTSVESEIAEQKTV